MFPIYIWAFSVLFERFFAYLDQIILVMG